MDWLFWRTLCVGLATYVPWLNQYRLRRGWPPRDARYCYAVWLRHLVMLHESGLRGRLDKVAELGPGSSLGVGLAALLSGATEYCALDVVRYTETCRNLVVLEDLLRLFAQREDIPGELEFPRVRPQLGSYRFPDHILAEHTLDQALRPARVARIREALTKGVTDPEPRRTISYCAPWSSPSVVEKGTLDLIWSQTVMEHVEDIPGTYRTMHAWLRPGGMMSHTVDFSAHTTATAWNAHWTYPDSLWRVMKGRRAYLLNRQPCSVHLNEIEAAGFAIVTAVRERREPSLRRERLAASLRHMSDIDLTTAGLFVVCAKPPLGRQVPP